MFVNIKGYILGNWNVFLGINFFLELWCVLKESLICFINNNLRGNNFFYLGLGVKILGI